MGRFRKTNSVCADGRRPQGRRVVDIQERGRCHSIDVIHKLLYHSAP